MTIAGFYLTPEGVVLGADSTSSAPTATGLHYFDFAQKIFEIGEGSTLGVVTWGLAGLGNVSYRALLAGLDDSLKVAPPTSVADVAQRWIDCFWNEYSSFAQTKRFQTLAAMSAHDPSSPDAVGSRTPEEEQEFNNLRTGLVVGFCVAGHVLPSRTPAACSMIFDPASGKPAPTLHAPESFSWWGIPNIVSRLVFGADQNLKAAVLGSGKWNGTASDFDQLLAAQRLVHASLPLRDAVDYVHSCIYSTIKAMKFSSLPQVCGGPIEIAVISSDRKFRWVRHKAWDAAINDGAV